MEAEEYLKKSIQHYEDNDYDGSIANHTKAIESDSNYVPAWCNRGLVWSEKGNGDRDAY